MNDEPYSLHDITVCLDESDYENNWVVGGAALRYFLNINGITQNSEAWSSSDIDFAIQRDRPVDNIQTLMNKMSELKNNKYLMLRTNHSQDKYPISNLYTVSTVYVLSRETMTVIQKIDFLVMNYNTEIREVIDSFDLDICNIALSPTIEIPDKDDLKWSFSSFVIQLKNHSTLDIPLDVINIIKEYALSEDRNYKFYIEYSLCTWIFGSYWNSYAAAKLQKAKFVKKANKTTSERRKKYESRGFEIIEYKEPEQNSQNIEQNSQEQ